MRTFFILFYLLSSLLSISAIAGTSGEWGWSDPDIKYKPYRGQQSASWDWVGTVSLGVARESAGETQTFNLTPLIKKTYAAEDTDDYLLTGEFFFGLQQPLFKKIKARWGLAIAATDDADLQGEIWNDADPQFNNLTYQYKIQHTRIALKGSLLFRQFYSLKPWVSASGGVAFNRAHSFTNTPVIFAAIPNKNFGNNTETTFSYSLGIGVQKKLYDQWELGIGYEFADWGKSQLDRAPGQTVNSGLELSHLYTNSLLVNVTLVI